MSASVEICNLLYRYAELIDKGALEDAADLFRFARIRTSGEQSLINASQLLTLWHSMIRLYPCGTPRTKHMITNPILDIDEKSGRAECRSYYTVFQSTESLPLQPIISGRYLDRFERVEGKWRFSFRDYTQVDLVGNLTHHLNR